MRTVTNAAIRHGIDNGYLLDPKGFDAVASIKGMGDIYGNPKVIKYVTDRLDTSAIDYRAILGRLARAIGIDSARFEFVDIEAALRQREVAIARYFFNLRAPQLGENYTPLDIDIVTTHLAKVSK